MDIESSLKKVENWYGTMVMMCILFAILSFIFYAFNGRAGDMDSFIHAVARFWASLALTIVFGVLAVTVKKIHKALVLIAKKK